jgi:hypothetical protein
MGCAPGASETTYTSLKPTGSSAEIDPLEELIRAVNEAQERDAEDERRLYRPMCGDRPSSFQRRRPNRR